MVQTTLPSSKHGALLSNKRKAMVVYLTAIIYYLHSAVKKKPSKSSGLSGKPTQTFVFLVTQLFDNYWQVCQIQYINWKQSHTAVIQVANSLTLLTVCIKYCCVWNTLSVIVKLLCFLKYDIWIYFQLTRLICRAFYLLNLEMVVRDSILVHCRILLCLIF